MPEMISLRSFRLATRGGHTLIFKANEPREVPEAAVAEAMAAGCVPTSVDDAAKFEDSRAIKVEFQGDLRRSVLTLVCKALADENNPKHFSGGNPTRDIVSERAGFEAGRAEIRDAWQAFMAAKNEGRMVETHPQAQNVLRVVEASTKGELVELANEFGIDAERTKGLNSRDLRRLLMSHFAGVVPA